MDSLTGYIGTWRRGMKKDEAWDEICDTFELADRVRVNKRGVFVAIALDSEAPQLMHFTCTK